MKKFDFSKEFGNIDPKYIEEAEREWSEKKENRRPKGWSKAAAACVIVTLGSVIFSNPHIQASIKNSPYTFPENCYFMLGDNRNDSKDSRSWKNKFVRFDQIVGKAVVRYYPSFKWLG